MSSPIAQRVNPLFLLAAFGSGALLSVAVFFNGEAGRFGGGIFASWQAHGVGTIAAMIILAFVWRKQRAASLKAISLNGKAPLWAYLGGVLGGLTVIMTSYSVNSPLALAGTLAIGLAGQFALSLIADNWGLLGLPKRKLDWRDAGAVLLIASGSLIIILFSVGPA